MNKSSHYISLILVFFIITFICGIELPYKEFDFTDHGYYLYNAFILAHGVVPTFGFGDILNSLFMLLNIDNYLFFEILYSIALAGAIMLAWISLIGSRFSYTVPIILATALSCKITYMMNYQNSPEIFTLAGFGVLYTTVKNKSGILRGILFVLSGLLLGLAILSNITLIPGAIITAGLIFIVIRKENQWYYFYISYFSTVALLLICYFYSSLSILSFGGYGYLTLHEILLKIPLLLHYLFFSNPVVTCIIPLLLIYRIFQYKMQQPSLAILTPAIYILLTILIFGYHSITYLQLLISNSATTTNIEYLILNFAIRFFYLLLLSLILFFKNDDTHIKIMIVSIVVITYACGLAVTTKSDFESHLYLFVASYITIIGMLLQLYNQEKNIPLVYKFLLALMFTTIALFSIYLFSSFSYRAHNIFSKKQWVSEGYLLGTYADKNKLESLHAMQKFYSRAACDNKFFLAYPSLPLIYYLFKHRAPNDIQWLMSEGNTRDNTIIAQVKKQQHWCVFIAHEFNGERGGYLKELQKYLERYSAIKYTYNSINRSDDISLYPNLIYFYSN